MIAHGIQTERSHMRAHVGFIVMRCYLFTQAEAVRVMKNFPLRTATQPGANGLPTAKGHQVPCNAIDGVLAIPFPEQWASGCTRELSTTEKGNFAVRIVRNLMQAGRLPLPFNFRITEDVNLQREGEDILAWGQWRIEVKCDFDCGPKNLGGTGNFYIQIEETNPFQRH